MPTSILHSISSFLSRRYNLNATPSDRDRESLAHDVAYGLKHIPTASSHSQTHQQQQHDYVVGSVEDGNYELETTLEELEQTLDQCELSLHNFEKKERFLFVRIEKYRKMIREQECYIIETQEKERQRQEKNKTTVNDDDSDKNEAADAQNYVENNDNKNPTEEKLAQLNNKHKQDQTNIQDVETINADIIAQIETLKRRIIELADKKQDILKKREECHDFLLEVAEKL